MKILEIIYSLESGGAERFVVDLSNRLCNHHEIWVCLVKDDSDARKRFHKSELRKEVHYDCIGLKDGFKLKYLFKIYLYIKKHNPDIIHFHLTNIAMYFLFVLLFMKGIRYYQTIHNDVQHANYNLLTNVTSKILFKHVIKLITISVGTNDAAKLKYGLTNTKLIYNGRERPKLSANLNEVYEEIRRMKNNERDLVFLNVGRICEQKNHKLLINSFNRIKQEGINFVLLIIGEGNAHLLNELKSISCENIFFLGVKSNVADYMYCSNAFCLSSYYEGMPITLIEAFSLGCIPISTPVSGALDIIKDSINGYLSTDYSIDTYVDAVKRFICNGKSINKKKLIDFYEKNLSMDICARKYLDIYEQ